MLRARARCLCVGAVEQAEDRQLRFLSRDIADAPLRRGGGGRVGRATAHSLDAMGLDYRIVEKLPERVRDQEKYVVGDAAELSVLEEAGIMRTSTAIVTTHDDDMNIYLTIYCRRLWPDVQIISRTTVERYIDLLHEAGADFVQTEIEVGGVLSDAKGVNIPGALLALDELSGEAVELHPDGNSLDFMTIQGVGPLRHSQVATNWSKLAQFS